MDPQIEVVAWDVRYWTESKSDKENLCGMCAIATAELWVRLKNIGIKSEIHLWEGNYGSHVFLVVDDHIVDVTATQFPKFKDNLVLIIHQRKAQGISHYQTSEIFLSAEELRRFQKKSKWSAKQIAFSV